MSQAQAIYVRAPRIGEVVKFATATTAQAYITPKSWKGRWVRFYAEGADLYVVWGADTTVTPTTTAVSTVSSNVISPVNTSMPLVASSGTFTDWFLLSPPKTGEFNGEEYFFVAGSNTTGFWTAHVSDHGPGVPA